jgi:hypothetical protein
VSGPGGYGARARVGTAVHRLRPYPRVQPVFVDWTSRNDERTEAIGILGGASVTLTGPLGAAYLHEDWTEFGLVYFTPPLPASDMTDMVGILKAVRSRSVSVAR